jgi:hypothetical protein
MFRRKGVAHALPSLILRSLFRTASTLAYVRTARLVQYGFISARYLEVAFGRDTFFLEAAAVEGGTVTSSYLLAAMMEEAFNRSRGLGRFVMGPDYNPQSCDPVWEGLKRSRQQWRATSFRTSIIKFRYRAGEPAGANGTAARAALAEAALVGVAS